VEFDPEAFVRELIDRLAPERLLARPDIDEAIEVLGPKVALVCLGKPAREYAAVLGRRLGNRLTGSVVVGLHGGHPIPNEESFAAGRRLLEFVEAVPPDTALLCFVAGGGSALAEVPRAPFDEKQVQERTRELLDSGAGIDELNRARASMSRIKSGRLIERCHARSILTLVLADVPSGDPAIVASGPTIRPGGNVIRVAGYPELAKIAAELVPNTTVGPAFDEPIESGVQAHLDAARNLPPGAAYISGGELPSRVVGPGAGGRNSEFVIRLAARMAATRMADRTGSWIVLSLATDGSDGSSDSAGGWIDPAALREIPVNDWLERSDSATLLAERGVRWPRMVTATNLMDLRIVFRAL